MIYLYNVGVTNEYLEDLKTPNQPLMDSLDLNGAGPRISPPLHPPKGPMIKKLSQITRSCCKRNLRRLDIEGSAFVEGGHYLRINFSHLKKVKETRVKATAQKNDLFTRKTTHTNQSKRSYIRRRNLPVFFLNPLDR